MMQATFSPGSCTWDEFVALQEDDRRELVDGDGGRYLIAQTGRDGDLFRPESFEGLEIPLAELWSLPVPC